MNYAKRINAVLKQMEKEKADWFFITNLTNVQYLSGYTGSHGILLLSHDKRCILTDGRYTVQVYKEVKDFEPVFQGNRKEHEAIQETTGDLSAKTVWFEANHCSFSNYQKLKDNFKIKEFIGKKDVVESQRMIKDEDEIATIRKALQVAEEAFIRTIPQIKEGMTERELAHSIEHEMWIGGATKESFDSLILFGERSAMCHGKPSDNKLKKGDLILMDFGCVIDHYCSDITRMLCLGHPADEIQSMYECVYQANQAAEDFVKHGIEGKQGDKAARDVIDATGREKQFMHGLGHGVGLEIHEDPRMSPLSEHILETGNVVTVEPGVYIEGLGGIRLEDMIVIQPDRCEVLNRTAKEMIIL